MKTEIKQILNRLGISPKYKGYYPVIDAIEVFVNRYGERVNLSQELYPAFAKKYNTTNYSIECSIRTIARKAYRYNKEYLEEMMDKELNKYPSNYMFLESIAFEVWGITIKNVLSFQN